MVISVDFNGMQRSTTQTDKIDVKIVNQSKVTDVLQYVKHQYPELHLDEDMILVTVNQEVASLDRVLEADDEVSFVPHIGGG